MRETSVRIRRIGLLTAAIAIFQAGAAGAATYTITTLSDDATANGNCTLREAITAAASGAAVDLCPGDPAPDEIVLDEVGTYSFANGEIELSGVAITIRGDLDHPRSSYTIDMIAFNRFLVIAGGSNVMLQNLELVHGAGGSATIVGDRGGALLVFDSNLTLRDVRISGSHAMQGGGLTFRAYAPATLDLESVELTANVARADGGGGERNGAGLDVETDAAATIRLVDVVFAANEIVAPESGLLCLGGGAYFQTRGATSVELRHLRFEDNRITSASTGIGAGFYAGFGGTGSTGELLVEDVELTGNDFVEPPVGSNGSAFDMSIEGSAAPTLRRLRIVENGADDSGYQAIVRVRAPGGRFSDFLVADGEGRGLYIDAQCATCSAIIGNLTITGHPGTGLSLGEGPNGASLRLENSIVYGNATSSGSNLDLWLGAPEISPENLVGVDPEFFDPATGDYHLAPGSIAVDAGDSSFESVGPLDLDSAPRVFGADVDLGAFERGGIFADGFESGSLASWSAAVP